MACAFKGYCFHTPWVAMLPRFLTRRGAGDSPRGQAGVREERRQASSESSGETPPCSRRFPVIQGGCRGEARFSRASPRRELPAACGKCPNVSALPMRSGPGHISSSPWTRAGRREECGRRNPNASQRVGGEPGPHTLVPTPRHRLAMFPWPRGRAQRARPPPGQRPTSRKGCFTPPSLL